MLGNQHRRLGGELPWRGFLLGLGQARDQRTYEIAFSGDGRLVAERHKSETIGNVEKTALRMSLGGALTTS